jgi:hypothetical protein
VILSTAEIEQFVSDGYVMVRQCFAREAATPWIEDAFAKLGYDPSDSTTWVEALVEMPGTQSVEVERLAPRAWQVICQLLGGEERVSAPVLWSNHFCINFRWNAERPWRAPQRAVGTWHKDAFGGKEYLDSGELGLLAIVFWSDVPSGTGGTFIVPDSIGPVARYLVERPAGVANGTGGFDYGDLASECHRFDELTGECGDVAFLHPFLLHGGSDNPSGRPRIITNEHVSFRAPLRLREEPDRPICPVERAILQALGVRELEFERH